MVAGCHMLSSHFSPCPHCAPYFSPHMNFWIVQLTAPGRSSSLTDFWSVTLHIHSLVLGNTCEGTRMQASGALSQCISLLSSTLPLKFQPLLPDSPPLTSPQLSETVVLCLGVSPWPTPARCFPVESQGLGRACCFLFLGDHSPRWQVI